MVNITKLLSVGISTSLHRHYYNSSVQPPLYTQLTCSSNHYTNASFCYIYDECINCSGSEVAIKCEFGNYMYIQHIR